MLANMPLRWSKVRVTLADERWVEPIHPESNEGLARRLLIQGPAAAAHFIGLKNSAENPFDGQVNCETSLKNLNWPLDGIFLAERIDNFEGIILKELSLCHS